MASWGRVGGEGPRLVAVGFEGGVGSGVVGGVAGGGFGEGESLKVDAGGVALGGEPVDELLGEMLGDAFGGGAEAEVALGVGEGGQVVEAGVFVGAGHVAQRIVEGVEIENAIDGVELGAGDFDGDVPVVGVEGFERAVGQADGVVRGEGVGDVSGEHGRWG